MAGALLSCFVHTVPHSVGLVLDYADGTLWVTVIGASRTLHQFSRAGTYLGSQSYSGLSPPFGAEFRMPEQGVLEPASALLIGAGLAGL